jgi:hypothetical protein
VLAKTITQAIDSTAPTWRTRMVTASERSGAAFHPEPFDPVRQDNVQAVTVQCPVCVGDVQIERPFENTEQRQYDANDV